MSKELSTEAQQELMGFEHEFKSLLENGKIDVRTRNVGSIILYASFTDSALVKSVVWYLNTKRPDFLKSIVRGYLHSLAYQAECEITANMQAVNYNSVYTECQKEYLRAAALLQCANNIRFGRDPEFKDGITIEYMNKKSDTYMLRKLLDSVSLKIRDAELFKPLADIIKQRHWELVNAAKIEMMVNLGKMKGAQL